MEAKWDWADAAAPAAASGAELIAVAHLAGRLGRGADGARLLQLGASRLFESSPDIGLSRSDRALLASCLKQQVTPMRSALRTLSSDSGSDSGSDSVADEYRVCKAQQLLDVCQQVVHVTREVLLPMANSAESRVFFNKLAGDHERYQCEVRDLQALEEHAAAAEEFYMAAFEEAQSDMPPAHPLRLSLALNLAIFCVEIRGDQQRALEIAGNAYDDAVAELGVDPSVDAAMTEATPHVDARSSSSSSSTCSSNFSSGHQLKARRRAAEEVAQTQTGAETTRVLRIMRNSIKHWAASEGETAA